MYYVYTIREKASCAVLAVLLYAKASRKLIK